MNWRKVTSIHEMVNQECVVVMEKGHGSVCEEYF